MMIATFLDTNGDERGNDATAGLELATVIGAVLDAFNFVATEIRIAQRYAADNSGRRHFAIAVQLAGDRRGEVIEAARNLDMVVEISEAWPA